MGAGEGSSELEESHETLSDQIVVLIFLLLLQNWISSMIKKTRCLQERGKKRRDSS